MIIPFLGGVGPGRSVNADPLRRLNLYTEIRPDGQKILMGTPGLTQFANLAGNAIRGLHILGSYLYAVRDNIFYRVAADGTSTNLGTLSSSTGIVSLADNGTQVMVVDGTNGYIWNPGTATWSGALGAPFNTYAAATVTFLDGYFAVPLGNSGQWAISAYYDGTSWNALDVATAESLPDNLATVFSDNGQAWLFGDYSTEVWYNSGDADFPFRKIAGANIEWGCKAKFSVAKVDNRICWLATPPGGGGAQVVINNGYNVQRISDHALEYLISQYTTTGDAIGYSYVEEGHYFYVLTFPSGNATFVWDASTKEWHERSSSPIGIGRQRGNCYACFNGAHIIGDYASGKLYRMQLGVYDEAGDRLRSEIRVKVNATRGNRYRHNRLQVEMQAGVGLRTGQGSDPQVMLDYSDDGGHTFGAEHWRGLGGLGQYKYRTVWWRLGMSRDRVYRLAITDPVLRVLLSADLEVQEAAS